ncbi:MAG: RICIN domain-containing protein [Marinobacter sp.]|nr:RICIN domain-containing protein [Marinobacter sp.]
MNSGAWVDHYACQPLARDQRWRFDALQGTFANQVGDNALCLDNNGTPWNNGCPNLQACNGSAQQNWQYSGQRITSAGSNSHSLDAYRSGWVGFWQSHGDANQQWELRMDSASGRWAEYRSGETGLCLTATSQTSNDTPLTLAQCNGSGAQAFERHADKSFRLQQDNNYALDAVGTDLVMYRHHGGSNQRCVSTLPQ